MVKKKKKGGNKLTRKDISTFSNKFKAKKTNKVFKNVNTKIPFNKSPIFYLEIILTFITLLKIRHKKIVHLKR